VILYATKILFLLMDVFSFVRYQVLTVASMKMTVFWDVAPCGSMEIDQRFRGAYCLNRQGNEY
jgi:hypothetical protein